ncbi:MAG: DUF2867 domain-containing protein [Anaeromyxobacter sp.]
MRAANCCSASTIGASTCDAGQFGVVTMLVQLNGPLGRAYFGVVKLLHRIIVRAMLRRAARGVDRPR